MENIVIPDELKVVIVGALTFLVTEGLKVVGSWFGRDLSGSAAGIAALLSGAVLLFADSLLALVPAEYAATVGAIFALAVTLLSSFGIHKKSKAAVG